MTYTRLLTPTKSKSYFLFGPRQTGKSTFVKSTKGDEDLYIDLLPQQAYLSYAKHPGRFRREVIEHSNRRPNGTIIVDEVQKIPELLDEVHELIESRQLRFILTGSSARKLRRGSSNLLAGRAYTYRLFPLTQAELGDSFSLEKALQHGCLPTLWEGNEDPREFLQSYVNTYLREEIQAEGLVRNVAPFSLFLDIAAANDGEVVNFSNIARECGVSIKTVQSYYQILEDTFLTLRLSAWSRSIRKRLQTHPRYYFFDTGVTNALTGQLHAELNPVVRGRRFEQFVILQIAALNEYLRLGFDLSFWRSSDGVEVDLLLSRGPTIHAAIEIKSGRAPEATRLNGIRAIQSEYPSCRGFVIGAEIGTADIAPGIKLIDWRLFMGELERI